MKYCDLKIDTGFTVESLTRGHFRAAAIVLCSEIVLCWEFDFIIHFLPLTE